MSNLCERYYVRSKEGGLMCTVFHTWRIKITAVGKFWQLGETHLYHWPCVCVCVCVCVCECVCVCV